MRRSVSLLLNFAHAIDHLFLLVFATAVAAIAQDFGFARWEDLMPYGAGAFLLFGLGSLPAGRLGDLWGRRQMMLVFYFGMGASALLIASTQNAWQMAAALTVMGAFSSIYHPVGIPMLVQNAKNPGAAIGVNGLVGNLGIAAAAIVTGFLVAKAGWRTAFVVPGLASIVCGFLFIWRAPHESEAPAKRTRKAAVELSKSELARVLLVMTLASVTGSVIFNVTTNANGQLLAERLRGIVEDPARLGVLLAMVYAMASVAQVVVGRLLDRHALKPVQLSIVAMQVPLLTLAAYAQGWWLYAALLGLMLFIFGAIPFVDAVVVRFVDDRMRSRVAGMRLAVASGASTLAVWALGPIVKQSGFETLMLVLAAVSACTVFIVMWLPTETARGAAAAPAPANPVAPQGAPQPQ